MRLHEALEKTETGKVRRKNWGAVVYVFLDALGFLKDHGISGSKPWNPSWAAIQATDWEPVLPERDEWEAEALEAYKRYGAPYRLSEDSMFGGAILAIARALKAKFGKPLDVERLARDAAAFLTTHEARIVTRGGDIMNAIRACAKAQQEETDGR